MNSLQKVFSGSVDVSRVQPAGLVIMLCGVLLSALSYTIARRISSKEPLQLQNALKVVGLIICAGGAMLAILG